MQLARLDGLPKVAGEKANEGSKADFLRGFAVNYRNISDKILLLRELGAEKVYQAILGTAYKLGISEAELQAAIQVGKGKKLEGLGFWAAAIAPIANLADSVLEAATGNKLAAARAQASGMQAQADAQILSAQFALDAEKEKAAIEKQKIEAQQKNTQMLLIGGGVIATVVVVGMVVSSSMKNKSSAGRRKLSGLEGNGKAEKIKKVTYQF